MENRVRTTSRRLSLLAILRALPTLAPKARMLDAPGPPTRRETVHRLWRRVETFRSPKRRGDLYRTLCRRLGRLLPARPARRNGKAQLFMSASTEAFYRHDPVETGARFVSCRQSAARAPREILIMAWQQQIPENFMGGFLAAWLLLLLAG